jgi:hypothetical protein
MKTRDILGYLGVIPFTYSLIYFDLNIIETEIKGQNLFIFYSVAILSFLSGTLWQPNNNQTNTALISNFFCLFAIFAIFLPVGIGLLWLASCYFLLWYSEYRLSQSHCIKRTSEYMTLRGRLTFLVIVIHLVALFKWYLNSHV